MIRRIGRRCRRGGRRLFVGVHGHGWWLEIRSLEWATSAWGCGKGKGEQRLCETQNTLEHFQLKGKKWECLCRIFEFLGRPGCWTRSLCYSGGWLLFACLRRWRGQELSSRLEGAIDWSLAAPVWCNVITASAGPRAAQKQTVEDRPPISQHRRGLNNEPDSIPFIKPLG